MATELPDLTVLDTEGRAVPLRDLAADRPILLCFLRHFGWTHCKATAAQLRGRLDDIRRAGATLVLVGNGTPEQARRFQARYASESEVYTDPDRRSYQALEMRRSTSLSLRSVLVGVKSTLQGHVQTSIEGDQFQLGGLLAVARGGQVRFVQIHGDAADRPDLDAALDALRGDDDREVGSA